MTSCRPLESCTIIIASLFYTFLHRHGHSFLQCVSEYEPMLVLRTQWMSGVCPSHTAVLILLIKRCQSAVFPHILCLVRHTSLQITGVHATMSSSTWLYIQLWWKAPNSLSLLPFKDTSQLSCLGGSCRAGEGTQTPNRPLLKREAKIARSGPTLWLPCQRRQSQGSLHKLSQKLLWVTVTQSGYSRNKASFKGGRSGVSPCCSCSHASPSQAAWTWVQIQTLLLGERRSRHTNYIIFTTDLPVRHLLSCISFLKLSFYLFFLSFTPFVSIPFVSHSCVSALAATP